MPDTERHTRYRQFLCIDCGQNRYSAGRPRCTECHNIWVRTEQGEAVSG